MRANCALSLSRQRPLSRDFDYVYRLIGPMDVDSNVALLLERSEVTEEGQQYQARLLCALEAKQLYLQQMGIRTWAQRVPTT